MDYIRSHTDLKVIDDLTEARIGTVTLEYVKRPEASEDETVKNENQSKTKSERKPMTAIENRPDPIPTKTSKSSKYSNIGCKHDCGLCKLGDEASKFKFMQPPLDELTEHIAVLCTYKHGSKLIQDYLQVGHCIDLIFDEIMPVLGKLIINSFGCHVVQHFLRSGSKNFVDPIQKHLNGRIQNYASHKFGCFVVQSAIEVGSVPQIIAMYKELQGSLMKYAKNPMSTYVFQKMIDYGKRSVTSLMFGTIQGHFKEIAMDPYACHILRHFMLHCTVEQRCLIMNLIERHVIELACNPAGACFLEKYLQNATDADRYNIVRYFTGNHMHKIMMSPHSKFVLREVLKRARPAQLKKMANRLQTSTAKQKEEEKWNKHAIDFLYSLLEILDEGSCEDLKSSYGSLFMKKA